MLDYEIFSNRIFFLNQHFLFSSPVPSSTVSSQKTQCKNFYFPTRRTQLEFLQLIFRLDLSVSLFIFNEKELQEMQVTPNRILSSFLLELYIKLAVPMLRLQLEFLSLIFLTCFVQVMRRSCSKCKLHSQNVELFIEVISLVIYQSPVRVTDHLRRNIFHPRCRFLCTKLFTDSV